MSDIDFAMLINPVACRLWGEPNRALSKPKRPRWGTRGSKAVDIEKGTWFDHEANQGGGTLDLIRSETGGTDKDALAWLEREGFANGHATTSSGMGKVTAIYDYTDETGALLFQVYRFEPKDFRQRRPDGKGGWIWNLKDTRRVLYRLPELAEALVSEHIVFLVEGEKDVEALRKRNIPATTNPGGVNKWRDEYNEFLRDADVVLLPDNDAAGREHMQAVAAGLADIAKRVRVADLAKSWSDCPPKGDVSDWFERGNGTAEKLWQLVEQTGDAPKDEPPPAPDLGLICDWEQTGAEPPVSWLVKHLIESTGVGIAAGQWGTYKTFVVLDLAGAIMTGQPFIRFPVKRQGGVLFIAAEGSSQVRVRLAALRKKLAPDQKLPFVWRKDCPRLLDQDALPKLEAIAKAAHEKLMTQFGLPLALVAVDTMLVAAGYAKSGDENDSATSQAVMSVLSALSARANCFVLGIDHFGKNVETGTRGSSAKESHADLVLALLGERSLAGKVENSRLAIRKLRGGESGEEIAFAIKRTVLGVDADGEEIDSLAIDWNVIPQETADAEKDKGWPKSLRLLHRAMMALLADCGTQVRPWPDGPAIRALDQEFVRAEFYKSYAAEGDTEDKRAAARRQAFHRGVKDAQERSLIGVRVIDRTTFLWLA